MKVLPSFMLRHVEGILSRAGDMTGRCITGLDRLFVEAQFGLVVCHLQDEEEQSKMVRL